MISRVEGDPGAGVEVPPGEAKEPDEDESTRGQRREEGLRWFGDFYFRPFLWAFGKSGISPNVITILVMGCGDVCGYFQAVGNVPLAAVFFALSGVLDLVDGYVAKKLDKVTVFGSFLDSFSDRISDAAIYLGIAVLYLRRGEGVYVLDMVAHNQDHDRDVFQICPGTDPQSLRLARHAHDANQAWNAVP